MYFIYTKFALFNNYLADSLTKTHLCKKSFTRQSVTNQPIRYDRRKARKWNKSGKQRIASHVKVKILHAPITFKINIQRYTPLSFLLWKKPWSVSVSFQQKNLVKVSYIHSQPVFKNPEEKSIGSVFYKCSSIHSPAHISIFFSSFFLSFFSFIHSFMIRRKKVRQVSTHTTF